MEAGIPKPLPEMRGDTKEFWEGARRHEFLIQKCKKCEELIYPPKAVCPRCLNTDMEWIRASGKGEVYSYTIVRQAADKAFEKDVPYVYAIIDLEEGVRIVSNVVNTDPMTVRIGMKVRVVFENVTPDLAIPKFEPA